MVPKAAPSIIPLVSGLRGTWIDKKSDWVYISCMVAGVAPPRSISSSEISGSNPRISIPKARVSWATERPMFPIPMIPITLSRSSIPLSWFLFHKPDFIELSAVGIDRARENINASTCSATAWVVAEGEFTTVTLCRLAAARSMLSTPTPARPTTLRLVAAEKTSAFTCVRLRTIKAS